MVSRDSNRREEDAEEGKRERSGSESSSDAPPASSSYSIMNNTFRVDSRYSALKAIGKGSFGFVCSAMDEKQVRCMYLLQQAVGRCSHKSSCTHRCSELRRPPALLICVLYNYSRLCVTCGIRYEWPSS